MSLLLQKLRHGEICVCTVNCKLIDFGWSMMYNPASKYLWTGMNLCFNGIFYEQLNFIWLKKKIIEIAFISIYYGYI